MYIPIEAITLLKEITVAIYSVYQHFGFIYLCSNIRPTNKEIKISPSLKFLDWEAVHVNFDLLRQ